MRIKTSLFYGVTALAIVVFAASISTGHHAVLRFNLEEMTETADRIFLGTCVDVVQTQEMIAQGMMPVTRYTFEVERVLNGQLGRRVTFRQLGHPSGRAFNKGGGITMHGQVVKPEAFIHGMSEYRVGDRLLLFLIPDYLGKKVTYPVGLYQGAFAVARMPSGQDLVRNSINNIGLFTAPYNGTKMKRADARLVFPEAGATPAAEIESLAQKRGSLPLEQFIRVVEQIHSAHGGVKGALTQ
jgi:hypothetical protein